MRQRGAHRKGSELPPDDCDVRGPDDTQAAVDSPSHSRVPTMLGWLQQLLLLASLAVVCSSSFDIANGRSAAQLDDILGLLRLSTVWICGAIVIGLYLSLPRALRSGARVLLPSLPSVSPPPLVPEDSPLGGEALASIPVLGRGLSDDCPTDALGPRDTSSPKDAPSSYSPTFVAQLRGQLVNVQHQLYASRCRPHVCNA